MVVTIYKIPNCVWCDKAVELANACQFEVVERDARSLTASQWKKKAGHVPKTAPQIFIGAVYVGGYDDFKEKLKDV